MICVHGERRLHRAWTLRAHPALPDGRYPETVDRVFADPAGELRPEIAWWRS